MNLHLSLVILLIGTDFSVDGGLTSAYVTPLGETSTNSVYQNASNK